jgi:D-sedoheptulose 7-phosphate isomerase
VPHLLGEDDMLLAIAFAEDDDDTAALVRDALSRGIMTIAPLGGGVTRAVRARVAAPFVLQEWAETYYHTLWETVHVFLERAPRGQDVGSAAFLYPFLGAGNTESPGLLRDVVASIHAKVADDAALRMAVASQGDVLAAAASLIATSSARGGTLLAFGNGGSATDANDFAFDCLCPPPPMTPIAAMSLAADAATATAIANDVGTELIFARQLIAHGRAGDVAFAISTSGGSRNVIAALRQARADGLATIALLGYDGGEIARQGLADIAVVVGSDYIPRIQEVQASIYHVIRELAAGCGNGAY